MNIKKKTVFIILFIFLINAFLVFAYYKFYLIDNINKNITQTSLKYESDIKKFIHRIENSSNENLYNICEEITSEYDSILIIKDESDNIIYSNESNIESRPFYISTRIIDKIGGYYVLNYYDESDISVSVFDFMKNFIIYELFLSLIIIIISYLIAKLLVVTPITKLQKDLKNYKFGIKPKKRKIKTEMDEIQNNFIELIEKLEEEKNNQNRIIASISHDIKTPLTSIMGYTSRLESASLSEETKKSYLKKIYNKSLSLKEIVEEFDDYLSCNIKETLKIEKYNISEILSMISQDYKDELKEKSIELNIINKARDEYIYVDLAKIKRIFSNIISNSVNHFEKRCGIINIEYKSSKDFNEFIISDNAGGVEEENLTKIFEPLFTTDPSRRISGLGLSICKEIISAHKGEIYARNNNIGGLSIYFSIKK